MARIDNYIEIFKACGLKVEDKSKRSATFIYKDEIMFHGKMKWNGRFEISSGNYPKEFEELTQTINLILKLKKSNLVSDKVVQAIAEPLFENDQTALLQAFDQGKMELVLNLKSNYAKENNGILKLKYLLAIIPRSSRLEFMADLEAIVLEMKNDNCSRYYIWLIISLHIASVIYHAFFFKLKGYFYPSRQQSNKD